MLLQVAGFFSLPNNMPVYVYFTYIYMKIIYIYIHITVSLSIYSLMDTLIHVPAILNNIAIDVGMQMSLPDSVFISFVYTPRNGISGSYSSSIFNF